MVEERCGTDGPGCGEEDPGAASLAGAPAMAARADEAVRLGEARAHEGGGFIGLEGV